MAEVVETLEKRQVHVRAAAGPVPRHGRAVALLLLKLSPAVLLLLVWQLGAGRFIDTYYLSEPISILARLTQISDWKGFDHIRTTLTEMVLGYVAGAIAGVVLGYVLGTSRRARDIAQPYIMAWYSIPSIALAPLLILWFGIGITSKVVMVGELVFFTVFFDTYLGVKSVDEEHVNLARLMGASEQQVVRKVILPSAFPYIMLGLRLGLPKMVIGAIVGEFVASKDGIGHYIQQSASMFDPAGIFAGILILLVMVVILNAGFQIFEKRLLKWSDIEHGVVTD